MFKKSLVLSLVALFILFSSISYAQNSVRDHIKKNEGLVLKPYKDPGRPSNWIVGYGHNLSTGTITEKTAECLLEEDIKLAQGYLKVIFEDFDSFSNCRRIALTDMMYCMGPNTFLTFKQFIIKVRSRQWTAASLEIKNSIWYKKHTSRASRDINLIK